MDRRSFLRDTGSIALAAGLGKTRVGFTDQRYDVAVVGAGTAGIPAAIFAAKRGLRVALLEAAEGIGGTLYLSSATFSAAGTSIQAAQGLEDSPHAHFEDALRINRGTGDHALLRKWTHNASDTIRWLLSVGWQVGSGKAVLTPEHELYSTARSYRSEGWGPALLAPLVAELLEFVDSGHIDLQLNTRMVSLIPDQNGGVRGVEARTESDGSRAFMARAVIVTTGGYGASDDYWKALHGRVVSRSSYHPHNKGDAISAIEALGGYTRFSENLLLALGGPSDIEPGGTGWASSLTVPQLRKPWEIYVNLNAQRFMREDEPSADRRERLLMLQPEWSSWMIYDNPIREAAPPFLRADVWTDAKLQRAFSDNPDFQKADSVSALAQQCGLPQQELKGTIDFYNAGRAVGSDAWGREYMPLPISTPPFFAVRNHGSSILSWAGIATDVHLRPLTRSGGNIHNLYVAGETLGMGAFGNAILSGSGVGGAVTFGRLLGERVLS